MGYACSLVERLNSSCERGGEHGKGYRSRFSEAVFGRVLLGAMGRIKTAFDPHNQMNPGKIAVPDGVPLAMLSPVRRSATRATWI